MGDDTTLEGPTWVERFYSLLPEEQQPRWRAVGDEVYRTIGGYVTGNLVISVIAGIVALVWPGQTFLVLAAIVGWYLMFRGLFDLITAIMTKDENDMWWFGLVAGILQIVIGFIVLASTIAVGMVTFLNGFESVLATFILTR